MMRRSRTIKPEFFSSADVRALPVPVRLTFVGLLLYVDDYGNESADAALVKAAVWPTDRHISESVVRDHLTRIAARGMVTFYEVDGREYLRVTNWEKHQRVDRPSRSNIPPDPARDWDSTSVANEGGVGGGSGREPGDDGEGDEPGGGEGRVEGESSRLDSGLAREDPPSPFCPVHRKHPTTKACRACGNARLALKAWEMSREGGE